MENGNHDAPQAIEGEYLPGTQGVATKKRRFRLTDARGVRRELAALYGEMRNGDIDVETAKAGGFLLRCLLESIRTDEIEQRLTQLEKAQQ